MSWEPKKQGTSAKPAASTIVTLRVPAKMHEKIADLAHKQRKTDKSASMNRIILCAIEEYFERGKPDNGQSDFVA